MKKRLLSVLLCLCMVMALLPTTALAWTAPDNITVNKATYHSNGALKSITASFNWYTGSASSRLVLMTQRLRSSGEAGTDSRYGDFTDLGFYGSKFSSFDAARAYDSGENGGTAGVFGIISYTNTSSVGYGVNTMTMSFGEGLIPLNTDGLYYVYLWTQYGGNCYPDTLICTIQVNNGAVQYAAATGRNTYTDFSNVESQTAYDVTVTPGSNMTRDSSSGAESQSDLTGAMIPVVYTANTGYYFPGDYSVDTVNGIMVRRDSQSQITVYGTPSADATITLTAPTAITTHTVTFDVKEHGTAPADQQVANGQKVTEPPAPTADGFTFGGWYKETGCTTPWDFDTDTVTGDITLYAKWTATSSATPLEETNFTYAYDVQRSPAFPTKNQQIKLWRLGTPIGAIQSAGSWKLTKAGTYSYMKSIGANTAKLDGIVTNVVNKYTGLDREAVVIHDLKNGDTHIAYGVVVAYDAVNGNAVFLGDSWSGGAGYLLATGERTGTIYATANEVATDYVQTATYGISLNVTGTHTFDAADYGYAAPADKTVTITNTGTAATGELIATLSGGASSAFTLTGANILSIASHDGTATFTVVPKTGLSSGIYTEIVTVSGTNIVSKSFEVSFTVNAVAPTTYTVTFDPNGGSVSSTSVSVSAGGSLSSLPTPTRSGYTFNGWYTAATGGSLVTTSTVFNSNATIYAQWTYIGGSSSSGGSYTPPTYKVESEVSKSTDGTVSSDHSTAKAGDKVTITVAPDPYYKVDGVVVKDSSGRKIAVTDNKDGTFTFQMPSSKVTVEPIFSWDNPFVDVTEDAYYAPAVEWALKNDVTNGSGDGSTFSPDAVCTRAQIVTFLWRVAGSPAPVSSENPFTDVTADSYYYDAVLWAVEQGITGGTGSGKFSPNAVCTRGQSVTLLYRADGAPAVSGNVSFSDVAAGSYCAPAVEWAEQNGITGGIGGGLFGAANGCTRAQIVTFLYRYLEN